MSANLEVVDDSETEPEERPEAVIEEFTEELPSLPIDPTSFDARIAGVESVSVIRELSKHHSYVSAYEVEEAKRRGEVKTYEEEREAHREAWLRKWKEKPEDLDEYIQTVKRKAVRHLDWGDIGRVWNASPRDAIEMWRAIRLEARDEFFSGHYGARAFESADYMHEAFRRAQYLAVRDGLIDEWRPRGASEFILIDQMTQAYVMQIHWTEQAMRRAQTAPRTESAEFSEWKRYRKAEAKASQWDHGHWDIPYQHQAAAIEHAFRLADLCMKSFQRAARQLANIRLVRAKTARAKRRDRIKTLKPIN